MDNIEYNINNAKESIIKAEPSLKKAKDSQASLRKVRILAVIKCYILIGNNQNLVSLVNSKNNTRLFTNNETLY